jgi:hypothetical protein
MRRSAGRDASARRLYGVFIHGGFGAAGVVSYGNKLPESFLKHLCNRQASGKLSFITYSDFVKGFLF